MSALKWIPGQYSSSFCHLAPGLTMTVHYGVNKGEGYVANALNQKLKGPFTDMEHAKRSAEKVARQILTQALAKLDDPPETK